MKARITVNNNIFEQLRRRKHNENGETRYLSRNFVIPSFLHRPIRPRWVARAARRPPRRTTLQDKTPLDKGGRTFAAFDGTKLPTMARPTGGGGILRWHFSRILA